MGAIGDNNWAAGWSAGLESAIILVVLAIKK